MHLRLFMSLRDGATTSTARTPFCDPKLDDREVSGASSSELDDQEDVLWTISVDELNVR